MNLFFEGTQILPKLTEEEIDHWNSLLSIEN
jgi:hypothetical protein